MTLICRKLTQVRIWTNVKNARYISNTGTNEYSPDLPSSSKVVICGGGIVGASVAYHLAERGWTDVTLLEQGRLTCGTTWHAVGLIGQIRETLSNTKLMGYSKQLYKKLEQQYGVGFKECGSITVAQSRDRLTLLRRNHAIAKAAGVETSLLTPSEIQALCQWIRTDDIEGGMWIPGDGALTAPDLAMAYTKGAKSKGVKIEEGMKVEKIDSVNGKVSNVQTSHGNIKCEYFVNCSGQWGRHLGLQTNPQVSIPQHPMEHFYIVSSPIDGFDRMMPVVRDYDGLIYAREWSGGLMAGGFETKGKPVFGSTIPEKFEFQLLSEDWDHFQILMDGILKRFPIMESTQVRQFVNGPESFTPDGRWNLGQSAEVKNYYIATGMGSNGIAASGGIGRHMAELITEGKTTINLDSADIKRHKKQRNDVKYLAERCSEILGCRYALRYPDDQYKSGRNLVKSPFHSLLEEQGASFGEDSGCEKPLWFSKTGEPYTDRYHTAKGTLGKPAWFEPVRLEVLNCNADNAFGISDISHFSKIEIKSEGTEAFDLLQYLCCNDVTVNATKSGMLNQHGGFQVYCDVISAGKNRFLLICPTPQNLRCITWIRQNTPNPEAVEINDITEKYAGLHVLGTQWYRLYHKFLGMHLDTQSGSSNEDAANLHRSFILGNSWIGRTNGFTVYVPSHGANALYSTMMDFGKEHSIQNIGSHTMRYLQTINFCPEWLQDYTSSHTPFMTGMWDMIDFKKGDFIGRQALLRKIESTDSYIVLLELENFNVESDPWIWGGEPIYINGNIAGSVSSSGYHFSKNRMYCMGTVSLSRDWKTASFQVDVSGKVHNAAIAVSSFTLGC